MASLHQLVLSASFLLLAVSASTPAPRGHGFGGERTWTVPSASSNATAETPDQWAKRHRFHAGDILDFKNWNGPVLLVREGNYEQCGVSSPPVLQFADGNTTRCMLEGHGLFYFVSGAPARCEAGQRMVVRVAARYSTISAPAPAPAPLEPDVPTADQSVPSDRPWKKAAYAVLGFLAGCLFTFLCLFFLVRYCWSD